MFEIPMIRVDQKEYLERLQEGEFFMRSSLYYQTLDHKDAARSDPYDGTIPSDNLTGLPFSELGIAGITNSRIMIGHTFIKCFFYYNKTDCHQLQNGVYLLTMKADARNALSNFSSSYALIILKPSEFVEQVSRACHKEEVNLRYSEVEYLTSEELDQRSVEFLTGQSKTHPVFYKNEFFRSQQEFRFCVQVPYKHISEPKILNGIEYQMINLEAKDETYTLHIGSLKSISCILPMSEMLNYPVVVDTSKREVSFLSEVDYEKIEGQRD